MLDFRDSCYARSQDAQSLNRDGFDWQQTETWDVLSFPAIAEKDENHSTYVNYCEELGVLGHRSQLNVSLGDYKIIDRFRNSCTLRQLKLIDYAITRYAPFNPSGLTVWELLPTQDWFSILVPPACYIRLPSREKPQVARRDQYKEFDAS